MKRCHALFVFALAFCMARADLIPLPDDAALKPWGRKSNVALTRGHAGALVMEVRPHAFTFGWIQRSLPAQAVPPHAAGVYGRFRSAPENPAQLTVTVIVNNGKEHRYFSCPQGPVADSRGEWIEFYAPFTEFKPEQSAKTYSLRAADLREGDAIQLSLSNVGASSSVVTFDRLRFFETAEAATVGLAIRRAGLARNLLPEARNAGTPHPRLLLNPGRLQRIRAKATAGGDEQVAYTALVNDADSYLKTVNADNPFERVLDFQPTGEVTSHQRSAQLEGRFTAAVIPLEILAAAYQITGDARYGRHAAKALVNAARSLDADNAVLNSGFYYTRTFYVRALAFGYDWLWPLLSPEERTVVKTTLLGFVLQIHADSGTATWGRRPLHRVWNWDPGLVSCAGLGMLALEGETATAEKAILFDLRRHLRDYLTLGIDADGAGHEGPGYLAYGIGAGPEFAECLREQGRGDLFTETNWQLIPPWLTAETLPDHTRWNNLSDCGHGQSAASVYSYTCGRLAELARQAPALPPGERLPSPEDMLAPKDYLWQFAEAPGPRRLSYPALASLMGWAWQGGPSRLIARGSAPAVLAFLLFHEPCPVAQDPSALLPDALHFRGRGLAVSRTGYDTNAVYFAVEAGPHAAGHDQSDKGSFTLYGYGADLAIDSGYGNDGEAQKSGSSHAHNMVLIDGQGQPMSWHNQSSGHITGYHHSSLLDWVRVDAREAWNVRYDSEWRPQPATAPVEKAQRHFLFVRGSDKTPPYLVVMDDLRKDGQPADYTWLWHIPNDLRFHCSADRWATAPTRLTGSLLTTAPGHPQGGARFTFTAPANGTYTLAGLTHAGGSDAGKSDSFWISVNSNKRLLWDLSGRRTFGWETFDTHEAGSTNVFSLKAGESLKVDLSAREAEAQLFKLALLPVGAELPAAPDVNPEDGITLTADDAQLLDPPLLKQPVPAGTAARAGLTVFPVTTDARQVTNCWFATSREGPHPRLSHTVRAVEPRFLMVLVPGAAETPLPQVRRLTVENGVGAEVTWNGVTDQFTFSSGEVKTKGAATDGCVLFLRREAGTVTDWALLDGTHLAIDGKAFVKGAAQRVATDSRSPR